MEKKLAVLLFLFVFYGCYQIDNPYIFMNIEDGNEVDFRFEKLTLKTKDSFFFEAYSFKTNNEKRIHGYWGEINDTIYFINPLFNNKDCIVKYPILVLNNDKTKYYLEQSSNCDDMPLISLGYNCEVLGIKDDLYTIKHTANIPLEIETNISLDYCLIKLSLSKGVTEFSYHYGLDKSYRVPWCFNNNKKILKHPNNINL